MNSLKSFPWAIFQCATANMKVIEPQSEPNPSYSPRGALGNRSSVTAPIIYIIRSLFYRIPRGSGRATKNLDNIFGLNLVPSVLCTLVISVKAGSPSDDDLEELAYMLYDNWERLGRRLGFDQATMTVLDKENAKVSEKALRMLIHWRLRMGSHGTYQVLYDALCHKLVNCKRIAQEICLSQEGN